MGSWVGRWACFAVLACGLLRVVGAQEPAKGEGGAAAGAKAATVQFTFERPGLAVPRFRVMVREDGTATYTGEEVVAAAGTDGGAGPATGPTTHIEQGITLTPGTTAKIFKAARGQRLFNFACASKAKNVANTGDKTLGYEGPDGRGACSYNYSENKDVVMLSDLFLGISQTLEEGRRLEFKRRYDHLGLDAELGVLTEANDEGRAVELNTIAPVLRQLAGDTEMMQRVRLRAAKLLDRAADGR